MDLGLQTEVEQQPSAKVRAVATPELTEDAMRILQIVAKLSLSSAQGIRAVKAILLDVIQLPSNHELMIMIKAATTSHAEKCKTLDAKRREALGPPHIHAYNAVLTWAKAQLQKADPRSSLPVLDRYLAEMQPKGIPGLLREVRYCRHNRNFNQQLA